MEIDKIIPPMSLPVYRTSYRRTATFRACAQQMNSVQCGQTASKG